MFVILRSSVIAAAVLAAVQTPTPAVPQAACPDPAALDATASGVRAHVRYLADDALEGRAAASRGERCAAAYIAAEMAAAGLEPAGADGSWFQDFAIRIGAEVQASSLRIHGSDAPDAEPAAWGPYGFSASASATGPLRLVEAPDPHAGAGSDLHGAIPVIDARAAGERQREPDAVDAHFAASALASRGALAVIVLLDDAADLPRPSSETRPFVPIPVAAVAGGRAAAVLRSARDGAVATVETRLRAVEGRARNVVGILRGADPARSGEPVIIGAHYDHLGRGGAGSLAPDSREVHNGADDNASGTAALLEAARMLAGGPAPARPVLFVAFSGEERGLLGSGHFVAHPTVEIGDAVAMINMDMVGRLRDDALTVHGVGTAEEWDAILADANASLARPFSLALVPDGYGPSDHASFYAADIPVLFLFTNTHADYHRPSDDWQAIDAEGVERVAAFAVDIARRLAGSGGPPTSVTLVRGAGRPAGPGPAEASSAGYGPYFGSIPDMSANARGVRLTGVREDSPAARAGVREGDIIVRFGGEEIADLYAFTYALRAHAPGDSVEVTVLRDGEELTLRAVLGRRR